MKKTIPWLILIAFVTTFAFAGVGCNEAVAEAPEIPEIPEKEVRLAIGPYFTNTGLIIGLSEGWYKELNITFLPKPYGVVVPGIDQVNYIASRAADMSNQPTTLLLSAIKDLPPVKTFVFQNQFFGYLVIGSSEDKSIEDFKAEGLKHTEALSETMKQLEGKKVSYDGAASAYSFVATALTMGGLTIDDVSLAAFADPEQIGMMLTGEMDYSMAIGLPAAMQLLQSDKKLLLSAGDIAANAKPSADSIELRTVYPVGWMTYDDFLEKEGSYDLILRLSSVIWREARFINENREKAIEYHLPFINTIAGAENTVADIILAYDVFDPFYSFEEQERWFTDPTFALYQDYVMGAFINGWVEEGYLEPGEITPDDVSIAPQVYMDMLDLKDGSSLMIRKAGNAIASAGVDNDALNQASTLLEKARYFFDAYNFLDAKRFAEAAKSWAEYAMSQ